MWCKFFSIIFWLIGVGFFTAELIGDISGNGRVLMHIMLLESATANIWIATQLWKAK